VRLGRGDDIASRAQAYAKAQDASRWVLRVPQEVRGHRPSADADVAEDGRKEVLDEADAVLAPRRGEPPECTRIDEQR